MHESGSGTSRHLPRRKNLVAFGGIADMAGLVAAAPQSQINPKPTLGPDHRPDALPADEQWIVNFPSRNIAPGNALFLRSESRGLTLPFGENEWHSIRIDGSTRNTAGPLWG